MTGILIRRGERNQNRDTGRRWPGNDGGRDWSDISISQGMPRIAGKHQKLKETQEEFFSKFQREQGMA